ncbi:WGR domain-containing protein [Microbispora sp. ATCC PTA-5024]|uniref:WGR domain-containing protein n=1 Tax=Microbispora sp. ATCC PTA-5024 TaxID=316330 RepID=UPI0004179FD9|nr:WGR domain-containing protein [Microbispora sp. ATCC PTA-5024]
MTYLELSEDGGGAHKFYETTVSGTRVTISYGRIGEAGQTKITDFPSEEKAQAAAARKIGEKPTPAPSPAASGCPTASSASWPTTSGSTRGATTARCTT